MRPSSFCFTFTTTSFFLLCLIHHSSAQLVGCDGNGVDCPAENTKVDSGVCSYKGTQDGIGIVSFDSNVTSDGPLTLTLFEWDEETPTGDFTTRGFYLGSPPALNFGSVTDFGACSLSLGSDIAAALQLPSGFNDFANFGCDAVMGESCAQDLVSQVRAELVLLLTDNSYDGLHPCMRVGERLSNATLPESCVVPLQADVAQFGRSKTLTRDSDNLESMYQTQDGCSLTSGGPTYNMVWTADEAFQGESDDPDVMLYKNGTSALLTMFYNESWNNASTGPIAFLDEPEVHLSCLRKMPTVEQQSGSIRLQAGLAVHGWMWMLLGGLLWTVVMS